MTQKDKRRHTATTLLLLLLLVVSHPGHAAAAKGCLCARRVTRWESVNRLNSPTLVPCDENVYFYLSGRRRRGFLFVFVFFAQDDRRKKYSSIVIQHHDDDYTLPVKGSDTYIWFNGFYATLKQTRNEYDAWHIVALFVLFGRKFQATPPSHLLSQVSPNFWCVAASSMWRFYRAVKVTFISRGEQIQELLSNLICLKPSSCW